MTFLAINAHTISSAEEKKLPNGDKMIKNRINIEKIKQEVNKIQKKDREYINTLMFIKIIQETWDL